MKPLPGVALCLVFAAMVSCADGARAETTKHKDPLSLFPIASRTDQGYYRFDYYDTVAHSESFPEVIVYYDKDQHPIDPLPEVKVGMNRKDAIAVLGNPYQDGGDNYFEMYFSCRYKSICVSYDADGKITKVEQLPEK